MVNGITFSHFFLISRLRREKSYVEFFFFDEFLCGTLGYTLDIYIYICVNGPHT